MPLLIGAFGKQYVLGKRRDNGEEGLIKVAWESEPNPERQPEKYYAVIRINPESEIGKDQKPELDHVNEKTTFYFLKLIGNIPQLCRLVHRNIRESRGEFCVYGEEFEEDGSHGDITCAVYAYTPAEIISLFIKPKIGKCLFVDDWVIKENKYDGENLYDVFDDPDFQKSEDNYDKWFGSRRICLWFKRRYPEGTHKEYASDALQAKRIDAKTVEITVDGKRVDKMVFVDGKGAEYIRGGKGISKTSKVYLKCEQMVY